MNIMEGEVTETKEQTMARKNLILYTQVGSHMYGTNTPESDQDFAGIFVPDREYVLGIHRCDQVEYKTNPCDSGRRNCSTDKDATIHSLIKFINLAAGCNPNIIEILYSNDPFVGVSGINKSIGQLLVQHRDKFMSQRAKRTFLGYAHSQRIKLVTKKDRLDAIREAKSAARSIKTAVTMAEKLIDERLAVAGKQSVYFTFEAGTSLQKVYDKLDQMESEYGLRTKSVEQFGYDTKFAMHLIRLLLEGNDILTGEGIQMPLEEQDRALLMRIRMGEFPLEKVLELADELMEHAESMKSDLPDHPDMDFINELQITMLERFWHAQDLMRRADDYH